MGPRPFELSIYALNTQALGRRGFYCNKDKDKATITSLAFLSNI